MRNSKALAIAGVALLLGFSSVAAARRKRNPPPGSKDSLYNGNYLKPDPTSPGGPGAGARHQRLLGGESNPPQRDANPGL